MSTGAASKAQRKAAVGAAVTLAQKIAETKDIPAATLEAIAAGLATGVGLAESGGAVDLDAEIATAMTETFGTVERGGPLWELQLRVARTVLTRLQPEEVDELVSATRWADDDVLQSLPVPNREPWEEAAVPVLALSATEIDEPANPQGLIPPEAQSGDEPVEVVEAELVDEPEEIGQTTSSQRRYRVPQGQSYAPGRRFGQALGSSEPRARERAAAQRRFGNDVFLGG